MTDTPDLHAAEWLNSDRPPSLADFRGRVLAVEAFQMLCPGCVLHGLPQAGRSARAEPGRSAHGTARRREFCPLPRHLTPPQRAGLKDTRQVGRQQPRGVSHAG